ncbi:efflux RND transporter permease subunit [Corallococcus sp. AB004]|nr:efflux RND transporter permease subunit [Corallococcus sp. AB004]
MPPVGFTPRRSSTRNAAPARYRACGPRLMGCILLVGLVVKNGILLLDRAEEGRAEGMAAAEAVGHATSVRLRPILMTTLATLLGLVPLALGLGEGGELQRPLAITVLGGLSLSTLTVLVGLPAAYVLVRRHTPPAKS